MSFQFRFESILELRRRERDEAGAAVGKANEAISRIDQQVEQILAEQNQSRSFAQQSMVGSVSVENLLAAGRYETQLLGDIGQLKQTRIELVAERDRRQGVLMHAEAEVKRFEKLKEGDRERQRVEALVREQADADDRSCGAYLIASRRNKP